MQINDVSGTIYPHSEPGTNLNSNVTNLSAGGVLYGNGKNIGMNSNNNTAGLVFGGNNDSLDKKQNTSIDRTGDIKLEEDVGKRLEDYRKQLSEWKDQKNDADTVNNRGLDFNSEKNFKDNDMVRNQNNDKSNSSYNDFREISDIDERGQGKSSEKEDRNDNRLSFEPVSYRKQRQRNQSRDQRNSSSDERRERIDNGRESSDRSGNRRFSLDRTRKGKTKDNRGEKRSNEKRSKMNTKKRTKKRSEKAGKVAKDVTKASLKASSGITAKLLMAVWGLGSALFKQDILFRLILGLFVGISFVAIVIMGR